MFQLADWYLILTGHGGNTKMWNLWGIFTDSRPIWGNPSNKWLVTEWQFLLDFKDLEAFSGCICSFLYGYCHTLANKFVLLFPVRGLALLLAVPHTFAATTPFKPTNNQSIRNGTSITYINNYLSLVMAGTTSNMVHSQES